MVRTLTIDPIEALPRTSASDVRRDWKALVRSVTASGKVVVTNHNSLEAVILSPEAYLAISEALASIESGKERVLEDLRLRFDDRLSALQSAESGDMLRALIQKPPRLRRKVRAGAGY